MVKVSLTIAIALLYWLFVAQCNSWALNISLSNDHQLTKLEQVLNKLNFTVPRVNKALEIKKLSSANLIFEETFEGINALSSSVGLQAGTDYGFRIVNDPVFRGSKSGRFELRATDPMVHRGKRSELFVINRITHRERWYSFAAFFPADEYAEDSQNELISQWHQGGSPPISLRTVDNMLYLRVLHDTKDDKWKTIRLAPLTRNAWHHFVFHIIHSAEQSALIEIWHNGEKLLLYTGRNHVANKKMPYWKIGVYKAKWNRGETDTNLRVVYFDDIRVGNEHATFSEMVPNHKRKFADNDANAKPNSGF